MNLAWGVKVSLQFATSTVQMCNRLGIDDPSWLMACMAFETGETFSPSVRNAAGSGAVGLIQFMPQTAAALGTSIQRLSQMTAEEQLQYVELYFRPRAGRLKSLGDVYGAILWPSMIGKPDTFIVFDKADQHHPKLYIQNHGLDFNNDGQITRSEIISRVQAKLDKGMTLSITIPQGALS
jgi:hypothetical protein